MRIQRISKRQFAGLNYKRFYFYDGIVSMPLDHLLLENLRKEKKKETHIEYLNAKKVVRQCERFRGLRFILLQAPVLYKLDSNLMRKSITKLLTKNYVLSLHWL